MWLYALKTLATPTLKPHRKHVINMHYYYYNYYDRNARRFCQTHNARIFFTLLKPNAPHAAYRVMMPLPQRRFQTILAAAQHNHVAGHRPAPLG